MMVNIAREWGDYIVKGTNNVSNADLDFEIMHGALQGFKTKTSNLGMKIHPNGLANSPRNRDGQEPVPNDAIDHSIAEATAGWHAVDEHTLVCKTTQL